MAANQMRGQLQVANDIGLRGNGDVTISPLPSTGASQAFDAASKEFSQIGARIGQMADKAAAREGQEEGSIAGLDPEFRTMRTHTIRGDAYDKAGLDVAETRLRQDVEARFDAAYQKHAGDPAALQGALGGMEAGVLRHTPEELRPQMLQLMRGKRLAYSREQARREAAEAEAAAKGAQAQQLDDLLKGMHQRAYAVGLDAEADQVLAADAAVLDKTLTRRNVDGTLMINPAEAAKLRGRVAETVATARLKGAFGRLPSIEAKQAFLAELEADYAGSKGLAKVYDLQSFEAVKNGLEADLRSAQVQQNAAARAIQQDVKAVASMAAKGYAPSDAELAALKSRVATANDPETAQAMAVAEDTVTFMAAAGRSNPAELDAFVQGETNRLKTEGATPHAIARVDMAKRMLTEMRGELKKDPLGWAERTGLTRMAPLDMSSPEALAATFKARAAQAETVAQFYGQAPHYLRPDERRQLSIKVSQGGADAVAVLASVAGAAGEMAPQVMAEIAQDAPVAAMLGGHVAAAGLTKAAQDAADGMALIKTEGYKPRAPSAPIARAEASAAAGSALQLMPEAQQSAIALANAAYEVRAARMNLPDFDPETWRAAYREVLGERSIGGEVFGGVHSSSYFGGHEVLVPPDVKQSAFDDIIESIRLDDLVAAGGAPLGADGRPVSLATVQRARLVSAGLGKYHLSLGDVEGGDPQWLQDANGKEYVLDLGKLRPRLEPRLPGAFLGGE